MLSFQAAEQLLTPLILRSKAQTLAPHMGFCDEAALFLVRQLRLEGMRSLFAQELTPRQRVTLGRCQWIDQQAAEFLAHHPNALGVELGAGLNTRFQRLSLRLDWPQFRWADIESAEIAAFNNTLLPKIDNYRLVGCDDWRHGWLHQAGWRPGVPLLIVLENVFLQYSYEQITDLFDYLTSFTKLSGAPVHLIMDYAAPALTRKPIWSGPSGRRCSFTGLPHLQRELNLEQASVLARQDLTAYGGLRYRTMGQLYRWFSGQFLWQGVHFDLHGSRQRFLA